jgi:hypothetical protein
MRAGLLPRFLQGQIAAIAALFGLLVSIALIALLALSATGVVTTELSLSVDPSQPFRW